MDEDTARALAEFRAERDGEKLSYFVEAIIAPEISEEVRQIILDGASWADRTRFLETGPLTGSPRDRMSPDLRRVVGGLLVQERDLLGFDPEEAEVVTDTEPTEAQMQDLAFGWTCCKHVKSNAIVLADDRALVGVGAGQMSRVDATLAAIRKAGDRAEGAVLASDAFFPFPDAVEKAAEAGVTAMIQPGGSKGDESVIKAANEHGIAMVFTGARHFRH
jgi:phosphoribosylaminoimidazolecarboxamide formyltransferase/IMP cyclohydrolase